MKTLLLTEKTGHLQQKTPSDTMKKRF